MAQTLCNKRADKAPTQHTSDGSKARVVDTSPQGLARDKFWRTLGRKVRHGAAVRIK